MTPDEYCQQKAAASGSSFYYSFRLLDPERRRAITALYAFCREVDDVVDECRDCDVAMAKLGWWRGQVEAIGSGKAEHPVARALSSVVQRFGLPLEHLHEIIDGMQMDLTQTRYEDFKSLNLYCYRVAGVVGLLSAEVFGYSDRRTLKYASGLGLALQLTNIIRDVGEDARRGRIYLPQDELAQHGVSAEEILAARDSDRFQALMAFQIARAEQCYTKALEMLPAADRKAQRTGLVMAAIYRSLLDEIRLDGCRVLSHRTTLTARRKLWLAGRSWLAA